ncbi:MAG: Gfo/Idh/MocA family oxidoreductase [Armatimonadetes bacterium]|nr:Gfo/Idh/MocA family oxidoreductase [Armatimonadota bacterium]
MDETTSRRSFLSRAATAAALAPAFVPAAALGKDGKPPAGERISLGIIGANGMGNANLSACASQADVEVTGVCDVYQPRIDAVLGRHKNAKGYRDFRELLARPDLDAVIIATPPHWHALIACMAAAAGKDIYLQKPMTLFPDEGIAVRNAVREHKVVCQVGTQIHASDNYRRCVEWVRSGKLGKISVVRCFNVMNQTTAGIGKGGRKDPPAGLDWDMWLGPAPAIPFNATLFADAYNHGSWFTYSGGWTPGMAPHIIDLPVWALELGIPTTTYCSGGRYAIDDDGDAPDVQEVLWQYPGFTMTWSMSCVNSFAWDFGRGTPSRRLGIYFHGVNGTLIADYGRCEIVPEGDLLRDKEPPAKTLPSSPGHEREWLNCIKSRETPSCSPDYHVRVDLPVTLANLSYKLGRAVQWDAKTEKVVGDEEAIRRARPEYRAPWKFPGA